MLKLLQMESLASQIKLPFFKIQGAMVANINSVNVRDMPSIMLLETASVEVAKQEFTA